MAEKKAESYGSDPSTQPMVDLLTAIRDEFRKQAQSGTPPPLEGDALKAVNAYREISEALDVRPAKTAVKA
ncbi:MAG: hypothetical protein ACKV2U_19315 [Bryobacteraceae bacterium]